MPEAGPSKGSRPRATRLRDLLLEAATADLTGVYEALWTANAHFADAPVSERLRLAEEALRDLLDRGLIELRRGGWEDAEQAPAVPPAEQEAILRDWASWAIPEGPRVFFVATAAGRRAEGYAEE